MRNILKRLQAGWDKGWKWTTATWLRFRAWAVGVLAALGIVVGGLALADDVNLSWTNAQFYEDGTSMPISEILETVLYKESFPLDADIAALPRNYTEMVRVPPAVLSYVDADQPNGIHCYVATHIAVNGTESAYSAEACKTIDVRIAGAPQGLTAD